MNQQSTVRIVVLAALFAFPGVGALAAWEQYPDTKVKLVPRIEFGAPQIVDLQLGDVLIEGDAEPTTDMKLEDLPVDPSSRSASNRATMPAPIYRWTHASANGGTIQVWDHHPRIP